MDSKLPKAETNGLSLLLLARLLLHRSTTQAVNMNSRRKRWIKRGIWLTGSLFCLSVIQSFDKSFWCLFQINYAWIMPNSDDRRWRRPTDLFLLFCFRLNPSAICIVGAVKIGWGGGWLRLRLCDWCNFDLIWAILDQWTARLALFFNWRCQLAWWMQSFGDKRTNPGGK